MDFDINFALIGRLAMSCILGGIIGYERESKSKSAGLRTNVLVCLGSCLIMILSQDIYGDVEGKTNADPARLAAQVVSGIGFLGAGAIMKEGLNVTGLTTAACLWVVAGVGLAVGAGNYSEAIATTVFVFIVLAVLARMDSFLAIDKHISAQLLINDEQDTLPIIFEKMKHHKVKIKKVKLKETDKSAHKEQAILLLEMINTQNVNESILIADLHSIDAVLDVEFD